MNKKNEALFILIHEQYYPMVSQMCLGFVKGDTEVASDLSQEVFINIWNKLDSFKGKSSHKTWVYRITVNTCLQYLRKEKNKIILPISKVVHTLVDEPKNTHANPNKSLYDAIGQLNEVDRLIIMMVLEGQDYGDISEVLGVNPTNVRVKIHRIKKRLKKILDNE